MGTLIAVRITKLAITEQFICLTGFVSALTLNLLSNFCLFVSEDVSALGIYIRKISCSCDSSSAKPKNRHVAWV